MNTKNKVKTKNGSTTKFCCCATEAENVFLAGTFNDWSIDATPMKKGKDGHWTVSLELPPGRHEFKFVVDGNWHCESNCVPNEYGTMNQIVDVDLP
jgi:5'-AMP-activated protein kinase regulatory beta subunit